jgi:hypothetical protein
MLRSIEFSVRKLPSIFQTWCRQQRRTYYKPNDGVLPRRESRRTLAGSKKQIANPTIEMSKNVLLPRFVSPGELRILLGIEYKSALALCQIKQYHQKYYWSDLEGRWFETSNKRKILVDFDSIAPNVKLFGVNPICVDPEPTVPVAREKTETVVIAVIGRPSFKVPFGGLIKNPCLSSGDRVKELTILPEACSDIMRARLISHTDVVCLFDDEFEDDFVIRDLCERFKVPMIRVPAGSGVEYIFHEVRNLALNQQDLQKSENKLVDPLAVKFAKETKRTDILVDAEKGPLASAIVLDVMKAVDTGKVGLVLVKRGTLRIGQHFVAGSGFGRITNIWRMNGERLETASPGMLVKVGRLVKDTGDFAPDDYLHVFPRERAWRLAFHRERIEWLNSFQTDGKKLPAGFELDSNIENRRTFAEFVSEDSKRAEKIIRTNNFIDDGEEDESEEPLDFREAAQTKQRLRVLMDEHKRGSILVEPTSEVTAKTSPRMLRRKQHKELVKRMTLEEKEALTNIREVIHSVESFEDDSAEKPLPESRPVIPLIIKTESVSQFDAILDQLESIEEQYRVKLPVVHGGIGPVTPNDLVHAEVESKFSPCSVYAVATTVTPEAQQSENSAERIVVFNTIDEVIRRISSRAQRFRSINSRIRYSVHLTAGRSELKPI